MRIPAVGSQPATQENTLAAPLRRDSGTTNPFRDVAFDWLDMPFRKRKKIRMGGWGEGLDLTLQLLTKISSSEEAALALLTAWGWVVKGEKR